MAQQNGLFGNIPQLQPSKEKNKKAVSKASTPRKSKTVVTQGGKGQSNKIETIVQLAKQSLVDDGTLELVTEEERFREYMFKCRENGIIFYDTETTGLDPIVDELVGVCIYTPGEKSAYIPMHHTDYSGKELPNQLSNEVVREELEKSLHIKFVYHNAKFDIRVTINNLGVTLPVGWDTLLASNFLNENEPHGLKALWNKYCNKSGGEALTFGDLFEGIPFNFIPPSVGYFYAAKDPKMAADLFYFQEKFLDPENEACKRSGLEETARLYRDIELPLISYLVEMEETGICIDMDKAVSLSVEYHLKRDIAYAEVQNYIEKIPKERFEGLGEKLSKLASPVNIASPTQLAIIIYDVLKLKSADKDKPRGTGVEILAEMTSHEEFFKAILEFRGIEKLLSTYIDKLPKEVKEKTKRLHGQINQSGAKTGRFSSSDPNLQNIPSHNKEIRKMFVATPGWVLMSGDYSQQEPRILSHVSDDKAMQDAYAENKDLYAWIASVVYKVDYDECKEFRPDGTPDPEGKKRRDSTKSIVLGLMYGRGSQAIADQLGVSKAEAQKITDMFFNEFPKVKQWIDNTIAMAKEFGHSQTVWGRKRRLPDIQLPEYEFFYTEGNVKVEENVAQFFYLKMKNAYGSQKKDIKSDARNKGIRIADNGGKISEAERRSVNSVIQGTAADITKRAMLLIGRSKELKTLQYRMLLTVHDEIIAECRRENALEAKEIVGKLMLEAADKISVPMKVDWAITEQWYGEDITCQL